MNVEFQRWTHWFGFRWRLQQSAVGIANCRISWVDRLFNALVTICIQQWCGRSRICFSSASGIQHYAWVVRMRIHSFSWAPCTRSLSSTPPIGKPSLCAALRFPLTNYYTFWRDDARKWHFLCLIVEAVLDGSISLRGMCVHHLDVAFIHAISAWASLFESGCISP